MCPRCFKITAVSFPWFLEKICLTNWNWLVDGRPPSLIGSRYRHSLNLCSPFVSFQQSCLSCPYEIFIVWIRAWCKHKDSKNRAGIVRRQYKVSCRTEQRERVGDRAFYLMNELMSRWFAFTYTHPSRFWKLSNSCNRSMKVFKEPFTCSPWVLLPHPILKVVSVWCVCVWGGWVTIRREREGRRERGREMSAIDKKNSCSNHARIQTTRTYAKTYTKPLSPFV